MHTEKEKRKNIFESEGKSNYIKRNIGLRRNRGWMTTMTKMMMMTVYWHCSEQAAELQTGSGVACRRPLGRQTGMMTGQAGSALTQQAAAAGGVAGQ